MSSALARVAAAAACLVAALLAAPQAAAEPACRFFSVYLDPDPGSGGSTWQPVGLTRLQFLQLLRDEMDGRRFHLVEEREDASWVMRLSANRSGTLVTLQIDLVAELALENDFFLAQLDREDFPYRGETGGAYNFLMKPLTLPESLRPTVSRGLGWLFRRELRQTRALCEMRDRLREEGWEDLDELRAELLQEMKRLRRERSQRARSAPPSGSPREPQLP